jgi:DNA phosphorothioation-dependent restriction protein DptH
MITAEHARYLGGALSDLLGQNPATGDVAFLRCLPSRLVDGLVDHEEFVVPGFGLYAVIDQVGVRRITADRAVELREDKGAPVLFLIDSARAGAGLDGIYSAAREIGEGELFEKAHSRARRQIRGLTRYADLALKVAGRVGQRDRLSPFQVLDFLVGVGRPANGPGAALARLGLWPILATGAPEALDLEISLALTNRLLAVRDDARTPHGRVSALMLDDPSGQLTLALEKFLHDCIHRSPSQSLEVLERERQLWLGPLKPQFADDAVRAINLVSWRGIRGEVTKWSGLHGGASGEKPLLTLDPVAAKKAAGRLEVRWTTVPDTPSKGATDYRAVIISGDEELAEQTVTHKEKQPQKATFTIEDFAEFDETQRFEAFVRVTAVSEGVAAVDSEEFILEFGQVVDASTSASGQIVRTLVEGAIELSEREAFEVAVREGAGRTSEDKKGFIVWRGENGRSVRVLRPALVRAVENDWRLRQGPIGRWIVRIREDGSWAGLPDFVALDQVTSDRLVVVSRRLANDMGPSGLLGRVLGIRWSAADDYLRSWADALDEGAPVLTLHGTVEVQSMTGRTVGLIATLIHPLKLAWQTGYDHLATYARYDEGSTPSVVKRALASLNATQFPAFLPGFASGRAFIFGDALGMHAAALVSDDEREPKAAIALMAACLGGGRQESAPLTGLETATVLGREITYYLDCHTRPSPIGLEALDLLNIQAWNPGDGFTVARAMGTALRSRYIPNTDGDEDSAPLCFNLDLMSSDPGAGRFFSDIGRRRRTGTGIADANDGWMTETVQRSGGILSPRLRWARREPDRTIGRPAHLALGFDIFSTQLEVSVPDVFARPIHAFGLSAYLDRKVALNLEPTWTAYLPIQQEGEKLPDGRLLTDRILKLQSACARATARHLGGESNAWPLLTTRLSQEHRNWIDTLHDTSDWVVTIDRNACIEYFDSPNITPTVYDKYVIDVVPERSDLGALQLVTSTSHADEVALLLSETLGDMGLSHSEKNCRFLLNSLKALSGRLAIRPAYNSSSAGELVALALVHAECSRATNEDPVWPALSEGFFIPVDEIADLEPVKSEDPTDRRADLICVSAAPRRGLQFRFVEVKFRRHLRTAREPALLSRIAEQVRGLRKRWIDYFFGPELRPTIRALRHSQLARLLTFYLDKAARHQLSSALFDRLRREIDRLVTHDVTSVGEPNGSDLGLIFCPEHRRGTIESLHFVDADDVPLYLFGPAILPDEALWVAQPTGSDRLLPSALPLNFDTNLTDGDAAPEEATEGPVVVTSGTSSDSVSLSLGESPGGQPLSWALSIRSNPHLMVVGLPGMGKTTALINICQQLAAAKIVPIVFSYHDDIDQKLDGQIGSLNWVDFHGLGFNPLRVDARAPTGFIDVAGDLRDIFSAVHPDLGELQTEEIRQAVKQSYTDLGWGTSASDCSVPAFRSFFDIIQSKPKPNLGLVARLSELADYDFFSDSGVDRSLLSADRPTVVRIHRTANDVLQRAFASFVLYSIYKDMFRRGVQQRLSHAIIFDEAHRAGRLKLIPTMAKECRKFGLSMILASQEVKDFDRSLFATVGSFLVLRVGDADARTLARAIAGRDDERRIVDRLKTLDRYMALFAGEGHIRSTLVHLTG